MARSGLGKIFAFFGAMVAFVFAYIEFYQLLNRIKMLMDAITFVSNTYNSVVTSWEAFVIWKANITYQISHPIFTALPVLTMIPEIVWTILKIAIFLYIALWILEWLSTA